MPRQNPKSQKNTKLDPRILFPLAEDEFDTEEEPLNEIDIMQKDFDLLSVKKAADDAPPSDAMDIMGDSDEEKFPLKSIKEEPEEAPLDISGTPENSESFPLKSAPIKDKKPVVKAGELLIHAKPLRASSDKKRIKKTALIIAWTVVSAVILAILWFNGGKLYTSHINEKYYKKLCHGEDLTRINPDFDFYLSFNEKGVHLPVVKSAKPLYYTSFDGLPFPPGTLTSQSGDGFMSVTGSSGLLKLDSSFAGGTVTCNDGKTSVTYRIYSAHDCTKDFEDAKGEADLTIFIEDASAKHGIFALHAVKE